MAGPETRPPSLRELQRAFHAAMLAPEPPAVDWASERRFRVYHDAYRLRLEECLAADFPLTRRALGEEPFRSAAWAYVERHPSRYRNVGEIGQHFPGFLAERSGVAPWLADLARYEWLQAESFQEADDAPLDRTALADWTPEDWARARIRLGNAVRLQRAPWPLLAIAEAIAAGERPRSEPADCRLLIYRHELCVYVAELPPAPYRCLELLGAGETLGDAVASAGEGETDEVMGCFAAWAENGVIAAISAAPDTA